MANNARDKRLAKIGKLALTSLEQRRITRSNFLHGKLSAGLPLGQKQINELIKLDATLAETFEIGSWVEGQTPKRKANAAQNEPQPDTFYDDAYWREQPREPRCIFVFNETRCHLPAGHSGAHARNFYVPPAAQNDDDGIVEIKESEYRKLTHPRVVIVLDGGLVQDVLSTVQLDYALVDYDVELGDDDPRIVDIPQTHAKGNECGVDTSNVPTAKAYTYISPADVLPERVSELFNVIEGNAINPPDESNTETDEEAERLLEQVQTAQDAYWDALGELETHLGIELDGTRDYRGLSVDDLTEESESNG